MAYVGGTRESRQLLGDVDPHPRRHRRSKRDFPTAACRPPGTSTCTIRRRSTPTRIPDNPFISRAVFDKAVDQRNGYPVPYRCFYSRNVDNLFMAGRCISVTHEALGTVRVMKTGGMMGEVVGKAASICVKYDQRPRDIYHSHLDELKELHESPGGGPARDRSISPDLHSAEGAVTSPLPQVVSIDRRPNSRAQSSTTPRRGSPAAGSRGKT